jgi:catechol 2,3-dioxygenase-like lactoylglutathione lyase family enzyme
MADTPADLRAVMAYQIEVITLPVSDVDKATAFYTQKAGFTLDVDYRPAPGFRVVQLTPPGSGCSVQVGVGLTDAPPGSARATCLAVSDIEAARRDLLDRGLTVGAIQHKPSVEAWQGDRAPGTDPQRRDYASTAEFADPDGNTWLLQEIGFGRAAG